MQKKFNKLWHLPSLIYLPMASRGMGWALGLFFVCQTVLGQQWRTADSIAVFRNTGDQTVALAKKQLLETCTNNLGQLYRAEKLYAMDNNGRFPKAWELIQSLIGQPFALICPLSPYQPSSTDWSQFDYLQASYTPPVFDVTFPNNTNTACLFDDNQLLCDGRILVQHPYALFPAVAEGSLFTSYKSSVFPSKARQVVQCMANLHQLALCAQLYANDNADAPAQSFQDLLSEGLGDRPEWLICPGSGRASGDYKMESISKYGDPAAVYIRCLYHGTYVNAALNVVLDPAAWEAPALIRTGPISQTVNPGAQTTLQVVSDYPMTALRFQWCREAPLDETGNAFTNTQPIIGATNASLILSNCQSLEEGYYSVVASHTSGITATSAMAFLRVESLTNITDRYDWRAIACSNNLSLIFAAWQEFRKAAPNNILLYTTSLDHPMRLFCPGDERHAVPASWGSVGFTNITYSIAESFSGNDTDLLASCPIHGFAVYGNGTVMSPPVITGITRKALNLIISGTNGFPGGLYSILASASVESRNTNWVCIVSNQFGMDGGFAVTNTLEPGANRQFYILRLK